MSDERRLKEIRQVAELLRLHEDVSQDNSDVRTACPLHEDCCASGDNNLSLNLHRGTYLCTANGEQGSLKELIRKLEGGQSIGAEELKDDEPPQSAPIDAEFSVVIKATHPVAKSEPKVYQLRQDQRVPPPGVIRAQHEMELAASRAEAAEVRRAEGERVIIALLAALFVFAGLLAAALSGFANYNAFASTVSDPLQARVWGFAGIIAAIVSFGGFTFVYWHAANKRRFESLRALIFALIGAGASILGTEIYIRSNNLIAEAEISAASNNRAVIETQISDWRRQLEGIPPDTRSVEGLEAYIAEVERVGRTDHKPYRDAQNELGLAKRRDEITAKIEAANAELLGQGTGNILVEAKQRAAMPSWLFALIIEIFSSQATSIGLVVLLIMTGRGRAQPSVNG